MPKLIIRDVATLETYYGPCAPTLVEFAYGEFAVDAINRATAEDMLCALRPFLGDDKAKVVVGMLLDAGLTFDSTLDGQVG